jgi:hypothetical protein
VVDGREEEYESGLSQTFGGELRSEGDGDAKSFKYVCGAGLRGHGAVAMLSDLGSGSGGDKGCTGGDVEGERTSAAGAACVNELFSFGICEWHGDGVGAHGLHEAGKLGGKFAAGSKYSEERCDLDLRDLASKDLL